MTGSELFSTAIEQRDYSGSAADQYAQLLLTIFSNIGDEIYPLLEKADKDGKKLSIKETDEELWDEISVSDIILV